MSTSIRWSSEPPLDALIPCRVYWIYGPHPTMPWISRTLLYVGECVDTPNRGPRDRFAEHVELQPWGDTVPHKTYDEAIARGTLIVSTEVYATKRKAREAERDAIIAGRPLYNWKCNELNSLQIPRWEQEAQRAQRDKDRNIPKHRTWAVLVGRQPVVWWRRPLVWWRRLRRREQQQIITSVMGFSTAVTIGVALFVVSSLSLFTSLMVGGGTVAVLALWFNKPAKRRKIRYALNEAARWAIVVSVAFQLFTDLF